MSVYGGPEIINRDLVSYWDAGGTRSYSGSGTAWRDISGSNKTATLTNSPTYNGNYFTFNGSNQYANCNVQVDVGAASSKTMCAWINPAATPIASPWGILDNNNGSSGWGFWLGGSRRLQYWPAGNADITDTVSVPLNTWSHVAISFDISTKTANFYINGVGGRPKTTAGSETTPAAGTKLVIGCFRAGSASSFFNGSIGNVNLYSRVLTVNEIDQNFNAHRGRYGI